MPEKMSFEKMISTLDEAAGRLIVPAFMNPAAKEAKEMILKVSVSLGEWAQELESDNEHLEEDENE